MTGISAGIASITRFKASKPAAPNNSKKAMFGLYARIFAL
jgi:hypothetical protein